MLALEIAAPDPVKISPAVPTVPLVTETLANVGEDAVVMGCAVSSVGVAPVPLPPVTMMLLPEVVIDAT